MNVLDYVRERWEESPKTVVLWGIGILIALGLLGYVVSTMLDGKKGATYGGGGPIAASAAPSRDYPLGAFRSGQRTGVMSKPQFLGDVLTITQPGDGFKFKSDTKNGSVTKGYADKWKLEVFREGNERQSIDYDSWGDLAYKLNQYMVGARYFIVNMHGNVFRVGNVRTGPVRKIKSGNDDFVTDIDDDDGDYGSNL